MLYDDEKTREFEKKFKQWTEQLKELTPEKMENIKWAFDVLEKEFARMKNKKKPAEEEKKIMLKALKRLLEIKKRMEDVQLVLGEKLFRNANKIYQHIKQKAAEGDADAIKAFKELEPEYQAMLKEQHPEN